METPGMVLDHQVIINAVLGVLLALVGWFARQVWDAVKDLQREIRDIEVDLPRNYIRRDEFMDNMREIKDMLGKIFDRLDNKADKI